VTVNDNGKAWKGGVSVLESFEAEVSAVPPVAVAWLSHLDAKVLSDSI
jgi:hypothetical protein